MKVKKLNGNNEEIERIKLNEKFFENCIDLIPANIYLNVDDRKNWFKLLTKSVTTDVKDANSNAELNKGEDDDDNNEDNDVDNSDDFNFKSKKLKFDPIFYKSVSQIYKELENCKKLNKPIAYLNNNNNNKKKSIQHQRPKIDDDDEMSEDARKKLKVENKNQSSGASKSGVKNEEKKAKKLSKKQQEKNLKKKLDKNAELTQSSGGEDSKQGNNNDNGHKKPILNQNGDIVYSKFDFSVEGGHLAAIKNSKSSVKQKNKLNNSNVKPKDYKILVKKLQENKEKLTKLKEIEPEKAYNIETSNKWKTVLDKASGIKVKDDVELIKKSIKRIDKKKQKSKKEWADRVKGIQASQHKVQEKRQRNIELRKQKKNEKKIKRLKKKGRLLPGF